MRWRVLFAFVAGACGSSLLAACALVSGASDLEVVDGPVTPAETGSSSGTSSSSASSTSSTSSSTSSTSSSSGGTMDAGVDAPVDAQPGCNTVTYGPYRCTNASGTAWQTPLAACAKDGAPAVSQGSPFPLALSDFDFAIPGAAKIEGIKVEITRRWTLNSVQQSSFGFRNKGSAKSSGAWTSAYMTVSYGGPTDKWGTTWQASDFADGLVFQLEVSSNGYGNVDDVAITVYACQ